MPREPKRRRRPSTPSLGRLRPGEIPGLRADGRPFATLAIVLGAAVFTVLVRSGIVNLFDVTVLAGPGGDWWKAISTTFVFLYTPYELAVLAAVFLFGWLLERRHGHWAPLLVYALGTAAGVGLTLLAEPAALITGGNAGALALLGAWVVRDLLAARRGEEIDSDLLGVAAIAIVLALLPAAVKEANALAGAGGALAGLALGFGFARLRER